MKIRVSTVTGLSKLLEVDPQIRYDALLTTIGEAVGLPPPELRLIHEGRTLEPEDDLTLLDSATLVAVKVAYIRPGSVRSPGYPAGASPSGVTPFPPCPCSRWMRPRICLHHQGGGCGWTSPSSAPACSAGSFGACGSREPPSWPSTSPPIWSPAAQLRQGSRGP